LLVINPTKTMLDARRNTFHQSLYTGLIDNLTELLTVDEPKGGLRVLTFGEFESKYMKGKVPEPLGKFYALFLNFHPLFLNFHPKTRPILWWILVAQADDVSACFRVSQKSQKIFHLYFGSNDFCSIFFLFHPVPFRNTFLCQSACLGHIPVAISLSSYCLCFVPNQPHGSGPSP
jgi:hypothetical protein